MSLVNPVPVTGHWTLEGIRQGGLTAKQAKAFPEIAKSGRPSSARESPGSVGERNPRHDEHQETPEAVTVVDSKTVDWLGIEKGTGAALLTVVDDLDWSSATVHLEALQAKLNTYLSFIESGEVFQRLAEIAGRSVAMDTPIKVRIIAKHPPTEDAVEFLDHATRVFASAGFLLVHEVLL